MTLAVFSLVVLAGGAGAGLRFLLDSAVQSGRREGFPFGILIVNVTGSFALGLLTGLASSAADGLIDSTALTILGTGLLGGYTTFSTTSGDGFRLLREGHPLQAAANLLGGLVLGVLAALGGLLLGASL